MKPRQSIKLSQVKVFFSRYESLHQSRTDQFISRFTTFDPRFREAKKEAEIIRRKLAPDFNVYRFLDFERQEEFHSRIIGFLLNPSEKHEQGCLFLDTFLKVIKLNHPKFSIPKLPMNQGAWLVLREVRSSFDRFDIFLRNPQLRALYVIENKIDADEQPDQILRYGNHLKKQKNHPSKV